jgi:hypothetical protein
MPVAPALLADSRGVLARTPRAARLTTPSRSLEGFGFGRCRRHGPRKELGRGRVFSELEARARPPPQWSSPGELVARTRELDHTLQPGQRVALRARSSSCMARALARAACRSAQRSSQENTVPKTGQPPDQVWKRRLRGPSTSVGPAASGECAPGSPSPWGRRWVGIARVNSPSAPAFETEACTFTTWTASCTRRRQVRPSLQYPAAFDEAPSASTATRSVTLPISLTSPPLLP